MPHAVATGRDDQGRLMASCACGWSSRAESEGALAIAIGRHVLDLPDDEGEYPDHPCPDDGEGVHHVGCGCEF